MAYYYSNIALLFACVSFEYCFRWVEHKWITREVFAPLDVTMNKIFQGFCHVRKTKFDEDAVLL